MWLGKGTNGVKQWDCFMSNRLLTALSLQSLTESASTGSLRVLEAFLGLHVGDRDTLVKLPKLYLHLPSISVSLLL